MIVGIGTDLCVVARFEAMLARRPRLAERLLTETERALPVQSQAARFAAKEALVGCAGWTQRWSPPPPGRRPSDCPARLRSAPPPWGSVAFT